MDFRRPTSSTLGADPRSSIWNLSQDHTSEPAPVPRSILRNPSSHRPFSRKNVQFRDRDSHLSSFVDRTLSPSDSDDSATMDQTHYRDPPVSARRSAFVSRQDNEIFISPEHAVPVDEPRRSRRLRFSSQVYGDYGSARARHTNARRDFDSEWNPNDQDAPAEFSHPISTQTSNLLFHGSITRHELRWDLMKPLSMSRINHWLSCFSFLDGPALGLNVSSAQIHFKESWIWRLERLWGPIIVRAKGPGQPITLRHILDEIFNYFQSPIEDANHDLAVAGIRREDIVDSWRQRNHNTYQPGYGRSPYMHDPFIRRVDFLLGFSLFRKLRLVSSSSRSCDLVLSIR